MLINTKQLALCSNSLLGSLQVASSWLQCIHHSQQLLLAATYFLSELAAVNSHRPVILQQHCTTVKALASPTTLQNRSGLGNASSGA